MAYGKPFSFGPSSPIVAPKGSDQDVLRDLLIGILSKQGPLMRHFNPVANLGAQADIATGGNPGQMPYTHRFVKPAGGWPKIDLPLPPLEPPVEDNGPAAFIPDASATTKAILPPGFMESLPPTPPTTTPINTNVTPRPAPSALPDPITRNRKGEAREALKGAGVAALLGLLLGGGKGALAAASGFGRGAATAADAKFADKQDQQKAKIAQQERIDQQRFAEWQNSEAARLAGNEGILDARNVARDEYNIRRGAYDRTQANVEKRLERQRREKDDAERAADRDLDRQVREEALAATKEARADANKYKRTPEQLEAEGRARRAMAGLAAATTIEEREYWGGVLASAEAALGYKSAPPPARGGKLVPTAAQQAGIDQAGQRIDIARERTSMARERQSVAASVAEAKKTGDTRKVIMGIEGKIQGARDWIYRNLPKSRSVMVKDPQTGISMPQPIDPSPEQVAAYESAKADKEAYITYLENERNVLLGVKKSATPRRDTPVPMAQGGLVVGNMDLEAIARAAGVKIPSGGTPPVVVDKPLNGYGNTGRRIAPAPRPTPRAASRSAARKQSDDLSNLSDEELLKRMAGKKN